MLVSVALRHPVLPHQLATKEVQVHQRTQSELIDEKEDGILEKRNEKRNCQPVPSGGFGLVALLFAPAWIAGICLAGDQGLAPSAHRALAGSTASLWSSAGSAQPAAPRAAPLQAQEVPKGSELEFSLQRSAPEFWALFGL